MSAEVKIIKDIDGNEHYLNRATATTLLIACEKDNGEFAFLLERRGKGCPDNVGKLCAVCGYLNWNETLEECVLREAYEETGFKFNPDKDDLYYWKTISDLKENKQNISVRFIIYPNYNNILKSINNGTINTNTKSRGGEEDEVSEFLLLTPEQIKNMKSEDFAFNHKEMIEEFLEFN